MTAPGDEPSRYSHPDEGDGGTHLDDHLHDVADRARTVADSEATVGDGASLVDVVEALGLVHDFGKFTTWFQQHIGMERGAPSDDRLTRHAALGAMAAYYALDARGCEGDVPLAGFVAVAKHHGRLPDAVEYVFDRTHREDPKRRPWRERIERQVADIDGAVPNRAAEILNEATNGDGSWGDFRARISDGGLFDDLCAEVSRSGITRSPKADAVSHRFYGLALRCWGTLVLVDKTSAAGAPKGDRAYGCTRPDFATLDEYVDGLEADSEPSDERERRLNELRSKARSEVLESVEEFAESDDRVATLTLPTGMGKTLTGLSAALRLRDATDRERVVYALPFTSIIDQVAEEVQDVFDTDGTDDLLTLHHHLADSSIELDDAGDDEVGRIEAMLGEGWRAGMTVTTFVQLFESLAGPRNSQSMKVPALQNSVVVLDEPQSLPHDWWKLVDRLVELLAEQYGATVVSMTATQPGLFEDEMELVDDPESYYEGLERVEYTIDDSTERFLAGEHEPRGYDSAAETLAEAVRGGDSVLSVCNTIDSARELTERVTGKLGATDVASVYADGIRTHGGDYPIPEVLADRVAERGKPAFVHLSTRIRPADRLRLVETSKALTERGVPTLVVSTQLIEAGVDVSFERVYRDLAPMDSVVQAAGRCNRSFERERGDVTVWWLDAPDDQETTPAVAVYDEWGQSLLPVTANALATVRDGDDSSIPEQTVAWEGTREYYRRLREDKDVGDADYVDYVDRSEAESLGALSLIDQRQAVDVLVCRTDGEFERVERIRRAWAEFDFERVRDLVDETREAQISVPIYSEDSEEAEAVRGLPQLLKGSENRTFDSNVRVLDARPGRDAPNFDATTGFVVPDSTVDRRFL